MAKGITPTRVRRKPMSEINMVPFIDIMMVLLVAFMISAPMLTQGIKVDLPKTNSEIIPLPEDQQLLIISVKESGEYFIDLGSTRDSAAELSSLTKKVGKVVAANPGIQVLINGDARVPYGSVVALMSGIQEAGISNVGLITEPAAAKGNR